MSKSNAKKVCVTIPFSFPVLCLGLSFWNVLYNHTGSLLASCYPVYLYPCVSFVQSLVLSFVDVIHSSVFPALRCLYSVFAGFTIHRFLSKSGLRERKPRRTPLVKVKEKHKKARLEFAKMHIDKPQCFWENVLWSFLARHINSVFTDGKIKLLKRRGCFAPSGTGCLESVQGTIKSKHYQGILEWNVLPSIRKLCLSHSSWVPQQNNDSKHTAKSKNGWEQNTGPEFWNGLLWALIWIPTNTYGKRWNI